ncbi:universal stress protein [Heyndrickxia coagulans]|uniref:Nucleotide-binding universal stress protein, UspA family n=1 Tax=Heyndrickxia coagulans DSM 1 = ATCC 7050 TaxID=1121088 RepID=A0A8B4BUX0_HEYCO|nr:universal stress protein [Heyndrickxia coagulans]AJH79705.1 universal stress family protein [Heyndrickxia coagulans DSM 1 = ATCC 7050]MBF8417852.1 universal stress protein [Heyndrickxia coagulans]MCR2846209.1 universal stress protein [Heyndrickxia coagulans]MDR4224396.1 universal stress protein [Heyndrickxia coagulans DSM 1 = ATCC 7050]MED4404471.1 universal stress protein [Heyndrickxia coagulans]
MYQHIAIAYDDSEGSRKALDRACSFALALRDIKLSVVHVNQESEVAAPVPDENIGVPPTISVPGLDGRVYPVDPPPVDEPSTQQFILNDAEEVMNHARELLDAKGVKADTHILEGKVADSIIDFARNENVDCIITGSSGKNAVKSLFIGSVSKSLVKNADVDVLVVK